jgi:hypothetical protein
VGSGTGVGVGVALGVALGVGLAVDVAVALGVAVGGAVAIAVGVRSEDFIDERRTGRFPGSIGPKNPGRSLPETPDSGPDGF